MALRFVAVLFFVISCSWPNDGTVDLDAAQQVPEIDQCFELRMEQWYISFHKYQEQGMDMFDADKRAMEDAERGYESCQKAYGKQIVSESK